MSTDLRSLSAVSAVRAFADGELSPVELMDGVIAHAERVEPEVNAFMATFYEQAKLAARAAEDRWQGIGDPPRPLEGVPLAVSDDLEIAGQPLTESAFQLLGQEVDTTEPLAERLYASGAVVHARTATSELLYSPYMHSPMYGATATPWNRSYNASGAGGGAAAALAAGTTVLAGGIDSLGCNTASAACGVVSLKPSYGRIPLVHPFALDTYAQYSPMARSVADCALLYDQLMGPHPCDPSSLPPAARVGSLVPDAARLRIAWSEDLGGYDVHPDVRDNTRAAMARAAEAGASVEEVSLQFDPNEIGDTILRRTGHLLLPMLERQEADRDRMAAHTGIFLDRALAAAREAPFLDAIEVENRLYGELAEIFSRYDALVCPALALPAFPLVPDESDFTRTLTGAAFTICSRHPYVSVPSGSSTDGVPTALLVVGPRHSEAETLRAAAAVEAVVEPLGRPPM
jgi:aspartyl-tRNA(Asn)/glutamyl-tRNA(Gln) amidotransferase subunit A